MRRSSFRPILACAALAAVWLVSDARPGAAQRTPPIASFEARAVDTSGPTPAKAGRVEIAIERWSTDADEQHLREALPRGPEALLTALKNVPTAVGVVLSPGVQGSGDRARERRRQGILFAREIKSPTGRRLLLATDEQLVFAGSTRERARPRQNEFTLIDIRFGPDGKGVGKLGSAKQTTYNTKTKTIELQNYEKLPVLLLDVTAAKR
jgi:hypothetical protein